MSLSRPLSRGLSRALSRGLARLFGGLVPTLYVDSVSGSDANDGLTAETPLQTLAAAQAATSAGEIIGLARGSYWREQYNIPADNVSISVYGTGAMPVIEGADVVGTWTQPDAGTYPNVWSQSWTRTSATTTGSEMLGLWENGSRPARYASSLADLQTNGGWYSSNLTAQTSTVYIKAASNPNSDGVTREITRRHYGINGHSATLLTTWTGQRLIGPLEIKRCVGHYNALSAGAGYAGRMFLRDGNIHHLVTEAALTEDFLSTEYSPQIAPSVYVAYRATGAGFNPVMKRLLALMPGGLLRVTASNSAFYSHSSVTKEPPSFTLEGCISKGLNFGNASSQKMTVFGGYCEDANQIVIGDAATLAEVSHLLVQDTTATPLAAGNAIFNRGGTATTWTADHVAAHTRKGASLRNVTGGTKPILRNCSISNDSGDGMDGGEFACSESVIAVFGRVLDNVTSSYSGDYNVFYSVGANNPIIHWNATLYSSTTTAFQSFVAASGQDINSVYLKPADQTASNPLAFWLGVSTGANSGPASGDFRINPGARVYDKDNTARIGVFGDGSTPITAAGPQEHWDFNLRAIAAGPPSRYPVLPATLAEMRTYIEDPTAWDFYP